MIFRLSVFCCGLSHNMWEKIVGNEWLEEKQCQRRNNCFNTTIRGKREHVLRIFCSKVSLREVQVGVWGMKKELVCFSVWCLCQSAFFGCKQQNQLWLSCRNYISRTVGNSGITREGREGGQPQKSITAVTEHQLFLFVCFLQSLLYCIQDSKFQEKKSNCFVWVTLPPLARWGQGTFKDR